MPGYPTSTSVTVTDVMATIDATIGNVAKKYVWLVNIATGVKYGPSAATDSSGNWSLASVDQGIYETFYAGESPVGVVPTQWTTAGVKGYMVSIASNPVYALGGAVAYNVADPQFAGGAKMDGVTNDAPAWQALAAKMFTTAGKAFAGTGVSVVNSNTNFTSQVLGGRGLSITVIGAGVGATLIQTTADITVFTLNGFVISLQDLQIAKTGVSTKPGIEITSTGTITIGRTELLKVQATGFQDGLLIDPYGFDQIWIDKCNFGQNSRYGIHAELTQSGCALLRLKDNLTNTNTSHGLYVHVVAPGILVHLSLDHHESVINGGDMVHIEGASTNTINGVELSNCDLEQVQTGGGTNSALYMKNVWKANLATGQYMASPGQTGFAGIWLDACHDVWISAPLIRSALDGNGNFTNPIYVTDSATRNIQLSGSHFFGTEVDFTLGVGVDATQCINLDRAATFTTNNDLPVLGSVMVPALGSQNLLGTNTASIETDTTGWPGLTNCTVAKSALQALDGIASLAVTSVAAGNAQVNSANNIPVLGGRQYTASAWFRAATLARTTQVLIAWFDASAAFISQAGGSGVVDGTTGWTQAFYTATAPATAAFALPIVLIQSTGAAGEIHYVDKIALNPGAGVTWMPGYKAAAGVAPAEFELGGVLRVNNGFKTSVIRSGSLPTVAPVSTTAFQCSTTRDVTLVVSVTYTTTAGTCQVQLSSDNSTFSTLVTELAGVAASVHPVVVHVPAGWWVKLTTSNAVLGTGTYY